MNARTRRLLNIITESAIEGLPPRDLGRPGAQGNAVSDARGKGNRGMRNSAWDAGSNVRIEIIRDTAYDDYGMILFATDVAVLRPGKFG